MSAAIQVAMPLPLPISPHEEHGEAGHDAGKQPEEHGAELMACAQLSSQEGAELRPLTPPARLPIRSLSPPLET